MVPVCFLEPDQKQLANSRVIGLDFLLANSRVEFRLAGASNEKAWTETFCAIAPISLEGRGRR